MKGKSALMAGVAAIALVAATQAGYAAKKNSDDMSNSAAPAAVQTDARYDELSQRIDALEAELQSAEMRSATDHDKVSSWKPMAGWWDSTKISGRMYYDITNIDNKNNSTKAAYNGTSFDIKRFYVGIDHDFNKVFSADITTDFTYDSGVSTSQIYIKKAYLQAKIDDAFTVRVGSADLPWVPYAEGIYGYRHIENTIADRTKFGTSADWGVHVLGKLAEGLINYQVSAVSGAGYKKAGSTAFRSEQPDVEGRVSLDYQGISLAVGGYWGKLGAMNSDVTHHEATRFNALAAYKYEGLNIGVEYFTASNWTQVKSTTSSNGWGVSPFVSYQFTPEWGVFGRYDYVKPYSDTAHKQFKNDYFNIGVQYSPVKIVDFALVYKHDAGVNGAFSDSNGTIGGSTGLPFAAGNSGHYNEIGLFGQVRW
jgi:hypothetical protein